MKKIILSLLIAIFCLGNVNAKNNDDKVFNPTGKSFFKVFWNYHFDMTKDVDQQSAFELKRTYLGYKYMFSKDISAKITLDVGSNDGGSAYTAFLKTAQLDWKLADPLKMSLGIIGMKQWNDQEKFWGYRYIHKSFQDEHKFGTSADMGVNFEIKPIKIIKINLLVVNGQGYKKIQDTYGAHRIGSNIVVTPIEGLTLKAYYDMMPGKYNQADEDEDPDVIDAATITNLSLFAGYKFEKLFRIGFEYNSLMDAKKYTGPADGYNLSGVSVYATYIINKQIELFGRFDQLQSNTLSGETENWNNVKDGNAIMAGIQFSPVKGVKAALNYRTWAFAMSEMDAISILFLNFEYKL